ncbi:Dipeptidase 1 [Gryllus bimaculatus]|nr:Dipeptidase 1 [Gryllus bimaculatus]
MYPELFAELLRTGHWTVEDLKKVAGLNLLRVFKKVEKVSSGCRRGDVSVSGDVISSSELRDVLEASSTGRRGGVGTWSERHQVVGTASSGRRPGVARRPKGAVSKPPSV